MVEFSLPNQDGYIPRIVDAQIQQYLNVFGAVEITGTKWCGKTWSACKNAQSISYVDQALQLAQSDPQAMLEGSQPHVIDEWQLAPEIWNTVRHNIDLKRNLRGAWILTGSSTPLDKNNNKTKALHSGAGRIGRIRMLPMTLAESGDSSAKVSLKALFEGDFARAQTKSDAYGLASLICKGGWPEALDLATSQAQLIANEYLNLIFEKSVPKYGKSSELARRITQSLARNVGQAATYKTILSDITGGEISVTTETLASYLGLLKAFYFIEEIPGWVPQRRSSKRLSVKPKRYFADPSLAVALLGMNEDSLLNDWQTFGLVFENLCMRDLSVYARSLDNAASIPLRYYRDDSGLEADAIIELNDGRWCAFEFKLGSAKEEAGVASLKKVRTKVCENPMAYTQPPEFMAVISGTGEYAYQAEEGIYVIPIRALGA